jgi:hypothetical protein
MPRRGFRFAGHTLRVDATEAPLAWLCEFVAPHFAAQDTDAPDRTIVLTVDAREHAWLAGHGPHPQRLERPCFTLDSGIVTGRVWHVPGASEVVFDPELGVFYRRVPGEATRVEIVAGRDDAQARLALLRVVREYAMLYAVRAGWLILHAAAVCVAERTFVIAGPKGAGKTTLLLHALRNEHGAYVANDRVALIPERSGVTAHGIPTIVSIRRSSTVWFGDLDARLEASGYHYGRRMTESTDERDASRAGRITWGLSPAQLCQVLAVDARAAARVTVVLFPRVGASAGGVTFDELTGEQALAAWRGALFRAGPADGMFAIGPDAIGSRAAAVDRLAARLAVRVPSLSCDVGPDAYRDGARWLSRAHRAFPAPPDQARAAGRRY